MLKIGRRDYVQLPQLGLFNVQAKIDTGAYGCSLHCHDIEIVNISGEDVLRFRLLDPKHPEYQDYYNYVREYNDKIVKNSGGYIEHRYTITSELLIFGKAYLVEFSLADRVNMRYPILLGRKFLRRKFVVDVALKNLSKKKKLITI